MITPIKTMTINQICDRQDDLLVSADDIREIAKRERNKAIDDLMLQIRCDRTLLDGWQFRTIQRKAQQLKGGGVDAKTNS